MFKKPFKVKSNTQLKGSDRKSIKDLILKSFTNLTDTDIETVFSKKQVIHNVKIITSSNEIVHIYTVDKYPMIFMIQEKIYPTVYLLWKFPNILHAFTTHTQVFQQYLSTGADLMLPGVITPPNPNSKYGNLNMNSIAYVNTNNNKAAIAVGVTAQSSPDMLKSGGRGKCLIIYHYYGDKLCDFETAILPIIDMGPPDWLTITNNYDNEFPELGNSNKTEQQQEEPPTVSTEKEDAVETTNENVENSNEITVEEMDELLNYCFLVALKYSKTLVLPILTSNFYKLQMLPVCPQGKTLDIKKTSFKKLKPFLDTMAKNGLVTIQETKKGVESIVAINKDHQKFTEFYVEPSKRPKKPEEDTQTTSTNITESYIITQNVVQIFNEFGLNKGDTVQMSDIRKCVTDYVKTHNCQDENNRRFIKPKGALVKICRTENNITWEELMEKICDSMKNCYKVTTGNDEFVNKGKISPITITVSTRSGNKKVTLVDNLELFNIRLSDFSKECQHGVAASTTINKIPGKKCDQLLVQGNQVLFVYNLLTEKYKIPSKYIRGLENAPKKKK